MKKDTTALNIRIDTSLYNLLQDATKTGQSKTYLVETALRCYLNVESSTNNTTTNDETEGDRAHLEQTVQTLTREVEHLKTVMKPQEELLAVTRTDKPRPTASLNTPPNSFGFAVQSLLKEESEAPPQLESEIETEPPVTLSETEEGSAIAPIPDGTDDEETPTTGNETETTDDNESADVTSTTHNEPERTEEESAIAATPTENFEPLPKNTPSKLPLEQTEDNHQDDLPLSYPEAPEESKTEEKPSEWMEPSQFAKYLSGILGKEIKVKNLTDKVANIKPEARKETENGFIFDFRGLRIERKQVSAGRNHYRLLEDNRK